MASLPRQSRFRSGVHFEPSAPDDLADGWRSGNGSSGSLGGGLFNSDPSALNGCYLGQGSSATGGIAAAASDNDVQHVSVLVETEGATLGNGVIETAGRLPHAANCTLRELRRLISGTSESLGGGAFRPSSLGSTWGEIEPQQSNEGVVSGKGGVNPIMLPPSWGFAYADGVRVAAAQEERLRVSHFGGAVLLVEKQSKPSLVEVGPAPTRKAGLDKKRRNAAAVILEPPPLTEPEVAAPSTTTLRGLNSSSGGGPPSTANQGNGSKRRSKPKTAAASGSGRPRGKTRSGTRGSSSRGGDGGGGTNKATDPFFVTAAATEAPPPPLRAHFGGDGDDVASVGVRGLAGGFVNSDELVRRPKLRSLDQGGGRYGARAAAPQPLPAVLQQNPMFGGGAPRGASLEALLSGIDDLDGRKGARVQPPRPARVPTMTPVQREQHHANQKRQKAMKRADGASGALLGGVLAELQAMADAAAQTIQASARRKLAQRKVAERRQQVAEEAQLAQARAAAEREALLRAAEAPTQGTATFSDNDDGAPARSSNFMQTSAGVAGSATPLKASSTANAVEGVSTTTFTATPTVLVADAPVTPAAVEVLVQQEAQAMQALEIKAQEKKDASAAKAEKKAAAKAERKAAAAAPLAEARAAEVAASRAALEALTSDGRPRATNPAERQRQLEAQVLARFNAAGIRRDNRRAKREHRAKLRREADETYARAMAHKDDPRLARAAANAAARLAQEDAKDTVVAAVLMEEAARGFIARRRRTGTPNSSASTTSGQKTAPTSAPPPPLLKPREQPEGVAAREAMVRADAATVEKTKARTKAQHANSRQKAAEAILAGVKSKAHEAMTAVKSAMFKSMSSSNSSSNSSQSRSSKFFAVDPAAEAAAAEKRAARAAAKAAAASAREQAAQDRAAAAEAARAAHEHAKAVKQEARRQEQASREASEAQTQALRKLLCAHWSAAAMPKDELPSSAPPGSSMASLFADDAPERWEVGAAPAKLDTFAAQAAVRLVSRRNARLAKRKEAESLAKAEEYASLADERDDKRFERALVEEAELGAVAEAAAIAQEDAADIELESKLRTERAALVLEAAEKEVAAGGADDATAAAAATEALALAHANAEEAAQAEANAHAASNAATLMAALAAAAVNAKEARNQAQEAKKEALEAKRVAQLARSEAALKEATAEKARRSSLYDHQRSQEASSGAWHIGAVDAVAAVRLAAAVQERLAHRTEAWHEEHDDNLSNDGGGGGGDDDKDKAGGVDSDDEDCESLYTVDGLSSNRSSFREDLAHDDDDVIDYDLSSFLNLVNDKNDGAANAPAVANEVTTPAAVSSTVLDDQEQMACTPPAVVSVAPVAVELVRFYYPQMVIPASVDSEIAAVLAAQPVQSDADGVVTAPAADSIAAAAVPPTTSAPAAAASTADEFASGGTELPQPSVVQDGSGVVPAPSSAVAPEEGDYYNMEVPATTAAAPYSVAPVAVDLVRVYYPQMVISASVDSDIAAVLAAQPNLSDASSSAVSAPAAGSAASPATGTAGAPCAATPAAPGTRAATAEVEDTRDGTPQPQLLMQDPNDGVKASPSSGVAPAGTEGTTSNAVKELPATTGPASSVVGTESSVESARHVPASSMSPDAVERSVDSTAPAASVQMGSSSSYVSNELPSNSRSTSEATSVAVPTSGSDLSGSGTPPLSPGISTPRGDDGYGVSSGDERALDETRVETDVNVSAPVDRNSGSSNADSSSTGSSSGVMPLPKLQRRPQSLSTDDAVAADPMLPLAEAQVPQPSASDGPDKKDSNARKGVVIVDLNLSDFESRYSVFDKGPVTKNSAVAPSEGGDDLFSDDESVDSSVGGPAQNGFKGSTFKPQRLSPPLEASDVDGHSRKAYAAPTPSLQPAAKPLSPDMLSPGKGSSSGAPPLSPGISAPRTNDGAGVSSSGGERALDDAFVESEAGNKNNAPEELLISDPDERSVGSSGNDGVPLQPEPRPALISSDAVSADQVAVTPLVDALGPPTSTADGLDESAQAILDPALDPIFSDFEASKDAEAKDKEAANDNMSAAGDSRVSGDDDDDDEDDDLSVDGSRDGSAHFGFRAHTPKSTPLAMDSDWLGVSSSRGPRPLLPAQPLASSGAPALDTEGAWRRPATPLDQPQLGSSPLNVFAAEFEFWAFQGSRPGSRAVSAGFPLSVGDGDLPRSATPVLPDHSPWRHGWAEDPAVVAQRAADDEDMAYRSKYRDAEDDTRKLALVLAEAHAAREAAAQVLAKASTLASTASLHSELTSANADLASILAAGERTGSASGAVAAQAQRVQTHVNLLSAALRAVSGAAELIGSRPTTTGNGDSRPQSMARKQRLAEYLAPEIVNQAADNASRASAVESREQMFEEAFNVRQQSKQVFGTGTRVQERKSLLAKSSAAGDNALSAAQQQQRIDSQSFLYSEAQRATRSADQNAQRALTVENSLALVELAGRGVCSKALEGAESAGRLHLSALPMHAQALELTARAVEQAARVRAVTLHKRPLLAGAEWASERAFDGAQLARSVQLQQWPLLQLAEATTPAQACAAAQLARRIERDWAPFVDRAVPELVSATQQNAASTARLGNTLRPLTSLADDTVGSAHELAHVTKRVEGTKRPLSQAASRVTDNSRGLAETSNRMNSTKKPLAEAASHTAASARGTAESASRLDNTLKPLVHLADDVSVNASSVASTEARLRGTFRPLSEAASQTPDAARQASELSSRKRAKAQLADSADVVAQRVLDNAYAGTTGKGDGAGGLARPLTPGSDDGRSWTDDLTASDGRGSPLSFAGANDNAMSPLQEQPPSTAQAAGGVGRMGAKTDLLRNAEGCADDAPGLAAAALRVEAKKQLLQRLLGGLQLDLLDANDARASNMAQGTATAATNSQGGPQVLPSWNAVDYQYNRATAAAAHGGQGGGNSYSSTIGGGVGDDGNGFPTDATIGSPGRGIGFGSTTSLGSILQAPHSTPGSTFVARPDADNFMARYGSSLTEIGGDNGVAGGGDFSFSPTASAGGGVAAAVGGVGSEVDLQQFSREESIEEHAAAVKAAEATSAVAARAVVKQANAAALREAQAAAAEAASQAENTAAVAANLVQARAQDAATAVESAEAACEAYTQQLAQEAAARAASGVVESPEETATRLVAEEVHAKALADNKTAALVSSEVALQEQRAAEDALHTATSAVAVARQAEQKANHAAVQAALDADTARAADKKASKAVAQLEKKQSTTFSPSSSPGASGQPFAINNKMVLKLPVGYNGDGNNNNNGSAYDVDNSSLLEFDTNADAVRVWLNPPRQLGQASSQRPLQPLSHQRPSSQQRTRPTSAVTPMSPPMQPLQSPGAAVRGAKQAGGGAAGGGGLPARPLSADSFERHSAKGLPQPMELFEGLTPTNPGAFSDEGLGGSRPPHFAMVDHLGSFGSFASYDNSSRTALLRSENAGLGGFRGADGYMIADGSPVGQSRADGIETLSGGGGVGHNEPSLEFGSIGGSTLLSPEGSSIFTQGNHHGGGGYILPYYTTGSFSSEDDNSSVASSMSTGGTETSPLKADSLYSLNDSLPSLPGPPELLEPSINVIRPSTPDSVFPVATNLLEPVLVPLKFDNGDALGSPSESPEKAMPALPRPSTPDFPLGLPPAQPGAPGLGSDRRGVDSDIAEAVARTRLRLAVESGSSTTSSGPSSSSSSSSSRATVPPQQALLAGMELTPRLGHVAGHPGPQLLWRGGAVQRQTGRVFMLAISALEPYKPPKKEKELKKAKKEVLELQSGDEKEGAASAGNVNINNTDDEGREAMVDALDLTPRSDGEESSTPRPLRLGEEQAGIGAKSLQTSPEKEVESLASTAGEDDDDDDDDGSPVLVVYVTDAATGIADSVGLSRAHLAAFGLGELLGVGMETPRSQHVLAAQLLEVLGAYDAPGSGAGPVVAAAAAQDTPLSSASSASSSGPMAAAQGAPRGFTPGVPPSSPALNLGPFRANQIDDASGNVFWLRGVQLPIAASANSSRTANTRTSSSSSSGIAIAWTGQALPLMLAMRLDPAQDDLLVLEAFDPDTKQTLALGSSLLGALSTGGSDSSGFRGGLTVNNCRPWLERALSSSNDGNGNSDNNSRSDLVPTNVSFQSLDAPLRRALCAWLEGLLYVDQSPSGSGSEACLALQPHPLLQLPPALMGDVEVGDDGLEWWGLDDGSVTELVGNDGEDYENTGAPCLYRAVNVVVPLVNDNSDSVSHLQESDFAGPRYTVAVRRRPTWLRIELTEELPTADPNKTGDDEDSSSSIVAAGAGSPEAAVAVAASTSAAAPPLPAPRSYTVDVPWSAWCRLALCGPLVTQSPPPKGMAQLAGVLAHHAVCFTSDRYGQRRALLDMGPRALRAAGAQAVLSFRAHPDDDNDDASSGRGSSPKSPTEEAEWAPLQIEAMVRAGGDDLWVAATYEATNETLTTRVPGATWRQWLEDAAQQAATQAVSTAAIAAAGAAAPAAQVNVSVAEQDIEDSDGAAAAASAATLEASGATPPFPLGGPPLASPPDDEAESGTNAMVVAAQPSALGADATPLTAAQMECLQDRLCAALRVLNDDDEDSNENVENNRAL